MKDIHWIIGPGAIGRLLAHSLSPLTATTLIGRRALPEQQAVTTPEGEQRLQHLKLCTLEQIAPKAQALPCYLHITTKAMAAVAALESLADVIPATTPLVLWQNGFLAQPRITQAWAGPVLCATTTEGAYLTSDDSVVHAGRGHTFIGDLHNQHGGLAQTLTLTLNQAGLAATAVDDIRSRLWQKLAVNAAINPLVALKGVRNGELRDAAYSGLVEATVKEVAAIMIAEGIQPPNGATDENAWLSMVWQVVKNTANNKASMLQDVEAKRPTERGAILGPLIESAQRHGLACETLQGLDTSIAALEASYGC
ncbi:ketopantoate reductase family protein [Halomonas sp. AOP12-C2-37]|uniref:ketopantoate reductase family protein n=1 Tax=unclassified Halomonas TaxID=2609666 RepID=UPI0040339487